MPYTLLIVEDEPDVRENLIEILSENSFKVIAASNGKEAVEKLENETPDLIISDIMMPVMDGYELLDYVQNSKNYSHIPFVFISAKSSMHEIRSGMLMGAYDYLTKPFRTSELLGIVKIKLKKKETIQKKLNEIKENIALSVPHEFRTPLTPLIGFSSMLSEDIKSLKPEEIEEMSSIILASALRLRTSVEKFILFSSLQHELSELKDDQTTKNCTVHDLESRIMNVILNEKRHIKNEVGVVVEVEECKLKMDEAYFDICVKELVENAFKFSQSSAKVKIKGKHEGDFYKLSIENACEWLSKETIKKVEILSKQFDPTMPGSGLGLPIVKKIANYFSCTLEVVENKKKNTKVTMGIPISN
jgi:two-component system, sensor histidine kinase and response regulator